VHPEVIIAHYKMRLKHKESELFKQGLGLRKEKTKRAQTVIHHAS
jgi:hypothetical protein